MRCDGVVGVAIAQRREEGGAGEVQASAQPGRLLLGGVVVGAEGDCPNANQAARLVAPQEVGSLVVEIALLTGLAVCVVEDLHRPAVIRRRHRRPSGCVHL
jgi:hypothetical protein